MSRPLRHLKSPKSESEANILVGNIENNVKHLLELLKSCYNAPSVALIENFLKEDFAYLKDYIDTTKLVTKQNFIYIDGELYTEY